MFNILKRKNKFFMPAKKEADAQKKQRKKRSEKEKPKKQFLQSWKRLDGAESMPWHR